MSAANGTNNQGHGHVYERPDGVKARCGGSRMCSDCAFDAARLLGEPYCACGMGVPSGPAHLEYCKRYKPTPPLAQQGVRLHTLIEEINACVQIPYPRYGAAVKAASNHIYALTAERDELRRQVADLRDELNKPCKGCGL